MKSDLPAGRAAPEPRYTDDEVREIFERATSGAESDRGALARANGLSLSELQAIGREVGVAPERIADAAAALEARRGGLPRRTSLGMPVAVGRVVDLPRAPTDHEWERLVAELRTTFGAAGRERSSGGLRHWSNNNLHAIVEPSAAGYRLRLGTTKGGAEQLNLLGLGGIAAAAMLFIIMLVSGVPLDGDATLTAMMALFGGLALGRNALTLKPWAETREAQMEYIAGRALALLAEGEHGDG